MSESIPRKHSSGVIDFTNDSRRIIRDNVTTSGITYICEADSGTLKSEAKWKIFVLDKNSGFDDYKWAEGNSNEDKVFDLRTTYTYK